MNRGRARRALAAGVGLGLGLAPGFGALEADAFVPKPDRALAAVAQANVTSGRTQAIQLDLVMRIGDRDAIATGQLVSHPSGLARLELRGSEGRVDRYLLSGTELLAAKDGETLDHPQPMLQPIFLLQPSSQETLRVALETFGVDSRTIGLAPCGDLDCYVFGDPALAAPEVHVLPGAGAGSSVRLPPSTDLSAAAPVDRSGGALEITPSRVASGRPPARLWVDTETLQVQRIDRESGESLQLGPLVRFERLMVPAWLEIQEPGQPTIHFDVKRAVRVNANPQAFNPSWLYSPVDPVAPVSPAGGAAPSPAPALASPSPSPTTP